MFVDRLPLARPRVEPIDEVAEAVRSILASGVLTNGPYVRKLEARASEYLGVRHCIAVSSCTAGLMLVMRVADLGGDVVTPSFTFTATTHAIAWNGLHPAFADIDESTLTLSPEAAMAAVGVRTSAILATHTFGTPCDVEGLRTVADSVGIRLFFDAAHAFGSRHDGVHVGGFGDAEVFSLSPTKPLIAGEGGIIATNDDFLAERCRIGRDYGNPGDYDARFVGLNARMSEVHAATALTSLRALDQRLEERAAIADAYRSTVLEIPGVSMPTLPEGDRSTFKDLTVLIDEPPFGLSAAHLAEALDAEGIETRRYYAPPVHAQRAYRSRSVVNGALPVTEAAAQRVLTLPLWVGMTGADVDRVRAAMERIHRWAIMNERENGS